MRELGLEAKLRDLQHDESLPVGKAGAGQPGARFCCLTLGWGLGLRLDWFCPRAGSS